MTDTIVSTLVPSARKLALAEHAGQLHGKLPYEYHLTAVVGVVSCFTTDPEVIAAAWLHDIVEDCPDIDLEVVEKMTTPRVAHIVDLLTDPPGVSRKERKAISLPRIAVDKDASLVRGADRFHNHSASLMDFSPKFSRLYLEEFDEFMTTLTLIPAPLKGMLRAQREYLEFLAAA